MSGWELVDEWVGPDPDHGHYRPSFAPLTAGYMVEMRTGMAGASCR